MNNNTELFNYSISNQRKEMQKQQLKSITNLNKQNNNINKNIINKEGNHEEYIKNQDNSMMINQIYNKKIIENTKETKELLTGGKQNNN